MSDSEMSPASKTSDVHRLVRWFKVFFCLHDFAELANDRYNVVRKNGSKEGEVTISVLGCKKCGKTHAVPYDRTRLTVTVFPAGTVVHYKGIPCELLSDTPYYSATIRPAAESGCTT